MILMLACLLGAPLLHAFCPKNGDWICAKGKVGKTHESITVDAITALDKEFFNKDKLTTSMQNALQQIVDANADVDNDQQEALLHFDGESFDEGQARLTDIKKGIEDSLSTDDAQSARQQLGAALHSIQDFYSHSNWLELGNGSPNAFLGRGVGLVFAPITVPTCQDCKLSIKLVCLDCSNNLITGLLTSGYYSGEDHVKPKNVAKCSHGGPLDNSTFTGPNGGINKDTLDCVLSPHNFLHLNAAAMAAEATKQFIRDIKLDITDKQLRELLGVGPTLAMAIDDTGSMGDIIGQVQVQAAQIVQSRVGTDDEPSNYILTPINDPVVGPTEQTDNPDEFIADIFSLFADGGGDCPELQNTGMFDAVDASEEGGDVFMFTDADSKDGDLADAVANLASTKNIQIYPMVFGNCSFFASPLLSAPTTGAALAAPTFAVDPSYRKVAQVSGGQVFALQRFEAGNVAQLANAVVHTNSAQLLSVEDILLGTPLSYTVPVDSTITQLTFSVSGATAVSITRPSGATVLTTDADVTFIGLSSGAVYTIAAPAVGAWSISINGSGDFTVNISAVSSFSLRSAHFVEVSGRSGHQGLYNIPGFPVVSLDNDLRVDLSDAPSTASFDLRTKAGAIIQSFTATPDANSPQTLFGNVVLPSTPFLVYVTGLNAAGEQYQRVLSAMIKPQTVKLVPPVGRELPPGHTTLYNFVIQNFGSQDTFTVAAKDSRNYLSSITPSFLTVGANGTGNFRVALTVPANAPIASIDTLTVTISGGSGSSNFATVKSMVENVNALPPDCSQAIPSVTTLWPPDKSFAPVNVLGVTDPQGQNITINIDQVLQDEPTQAPGQGNVCPAATGINTATASLLADRSGNGNGRVYHVLFTATNDSGLSCSSEVKVSVPHDQSGPAIDDGALFDSTSCTK